MQSSGMKVTKQNVAILKCYWRVDPVQQLQSNLCDSLVITVSPQITHKCTWQWYVTFAVKCFKNENFFFKWKYLIQLFKIWLPIPSFCDRKSAPRAQNSRVCFYMTDTSSDKSVLCPLITRYTPADNVWITKGFQLEVFWFSWEEAESHKPPHGTPCTWSFLSQIQKEAFFVWGPPFSFHPLLTCCFPVGNDSSAQSKQRLPLWMEMPIFSVHIVSATQRVI